VRLIVSLSTRRAVAAAACRFAACRTWVSGVTAESLQGAPELAEVQKAAADLLQARTLVGHGLSKDLRVLMLSHPRKAIRDTAK
jgi:RNA exonuclease 4